MPRSSEEIRRIVGSALGEVLRKRIRRIDRNMQRLEESLLLLERMGKEHVAEQAREKVKHGSTD